MKKYIPLFVLFLTQTFFFASAMDDNPSIYKQFSCDTTNQELMNRRASFKNVSVLDPLGVCAVDSGIDCHLLPMTERPGVCFDFAMKEILKKYEMGSNFKIAGNQDWLDQLHRFRNTKNPKRGDLIAYFTIVSDGDRDSGAKVRISHYGIISQPSDMRVRSKWGITKAIYTHDLFCVPREYGNYAVLFRLKRQYRYPGVWQDTMVRSIKKMETSQTVQDELQLVEAKLLRLAATPVSEASHKGFSIISLLERYSAVSVDTKDVDRGRTPLMMATIYKNPILVGLFLAYGADATLCDNFERTALDIAKAQGNREIQQLLEK